VVRGPAAVLAGALVALLYALLAPALPELPPGDATFLVAGAAGALSVAAAALGTLPLAGHPALAALLLAGAGLLAAAGAEAGAGPEANAPEALAAAAVGLLLARGLGSPAVALAVPVFVAAVDAWSVAAGPTQRLLEAGPETVDALTFALPAWGREGVAGRLGLVDATFLAMFAAWGVRYGRGAGPTVAGLLAGLLAAIALSVLLDAAVPVLPALAAGFLAANARPLLAAVRAGDGG